MRFQVMRRWRSPSIAFAKAPRGRISSGIEDQNAAASPSAIATIARQSWCAARSAPSQPAGGHLMSTEMPKRTVQRSP
jgi:hypothetical protein